MRFSKSSSSEKKTEDGQHTVCPKVPDKNIERFGATELGKELQIINIIGQIEGHTVLPQQNKTTKYEHLVPILAEIEQKAETKGLLVILNTVGGDVEAGLAIAELIRGMSKPTVSLVLGGGHSIGVPLAVSTDYSFITPTASMTIHPMRTTGLFITAPQSFQYYIKMQERVIKFICANSNIARKDLELLMNNKNQLADDIGTVLIGEQAVEVGLIDRVGGLKDALDKLHRLISKKNKE